jgi:plasmid maintenance system antidote protein VapI
MSRMGDLIKQQRIKSNLTPKALAKKCGVAESFILEVESGRRIVTDDVATRLLKAVGHNVEMLADFEARATDNTPMPESIRRTPVQPKAVKPQPVSDVWRDALSDIVKRVPVQNEQLKTIAYRNLPVENGQIAGAAHDKVFYYKVPDQKMAGYRLRAGDEVLCVPAASPVDNALMVVKHEGQAIARKVKKLEGNRCVLQWFDTEPSLLTLKNEEVTFLGKAVRVEFVP